MENLKKDAKIGVIREKYEEKGAEALTNKEILNLVMKNVERMEDMVRSVDDRERLLQKQFERMNQKLDSFIAERFRDDEQNKRRTDNWKWFVAIALNIMLWFITFWWSTL